MTRFQDGDFIRVHGLQSAAAQKFNGLYGIIDGNINENGRFDVKLEDGTMAQLKPSNMSAVLSEAPEKEDQQDTNSQSNFVSASEQSKVLAPLPSRFEVGMDVMIHSLTSAGGIPMNGKAGVITTELMNGRYAVTCADGSVLLLKPENLKPFIICKVGDSVMISGLSSTSGRPYNGAIGIVTAGLNENGRYTINTGAESLQLKPVNVSVYTSPKPAVEFKELDYVTVTNMNSLYRNQSGIIVEKQNGEYVLSLEDGSVCKVKPHEIDLVVEPSESVASFGVGAPKKSVIFTESKEPSPKHVSFAATNHDSNYSAATKTSRKEEPAPKHVSFAAAVETLEHASSDIDPATKSSAKTNPSIATTTAWHSAYAKSFTYDKSNDDKSFKVGDFVLIDGLKNATKFNQQVGIVLAEANDKGRYTVEAPTGEHCLLLPKNLSLFEVPLEEDNNLSLHENGVLAGVDKEETAEDNPFFHLFQTPQEDESVASQESSDQEQEPATQHVVADTQESTSYYRSTKQSSEPVASYIRLLFDSSIHLDTDATEDVSVIRYELDGTISISGRCWYNGKEYIDRSITGSSLIYFDTKRPQIKPQEVYSQVNLDGSVMVNLFDGVKIGIHCMFNGQTNIECGSVLFTLTQDLNNRITLKEYFDESLEREVTIEDVLCSDTVILRLDDGKTEMKLFTDEVNRDVLLDCSNPSTKVVKQNLNAWFDAGLIDTCIMLDGSFKFVTTAPVLVGPLYIFKDINNLLIICVQIQGQYVSVYKRF